MRISFQSVYWHINIFKRLSDKFEVGGVIIMTAGERFYELRKKRVTLLFMAVMCIVFVVDLMLAPHPVSLEYLVYGNDYGLITEYGR